MNLSMRTVGSARATTGTLFAGPLKLYTLELPWQDNQPDVSCVPAGEYQLIPYLSPKHGPTWRLHNPQLNVWGRDPPAPDGMRLQIEIHSGNWAEQLLGCIALGLEAAPMLNPATGRVESAVEHSVDAVNELHALLDQGEESDILIIARNLP